MWFVAIFVVLLCYFWGAPKLEALSRKAASESFRNFILGLSVFLLHTPQHISPTSVCTSTSKLKTKICQRLNTGTQTHEVCSVYVQAWRAGDCFVLHKGHSCNSSGNKTVISQRLHSHMDACCPGRAIFPLHTPASSGQILCQIHTPQFFHRGRFMSQQPLLDVQKFSTNQPQTLIHANPKPQAGNHEPYTRSYSPKLQRQTMHPTTLLPGGTPSGDRVSCTQVGFSLAYRLAGALQSQGFRVLGLDFRCRVWN